MYWQKDFYNSEGIQKLFKEATEKANLVTENHVLQMEFFTNLNTVKQDSKRYIL